MEDFIAHSIVETVESLLPRGSGKKSLVFNLSIGYFVSEAEFRRRQSFSFLVNRDCNYTAVFISLDNKKTWECLGYHDSGWRDVIQTRLHRMWLDYRDDLSNKLDEFKKANVGKPLKPSIEWLVGNVFAINEQVKISHHLLSDPYIQWANCSHIAKETKKGERQSVTSFVVLDKDGKEPPVPPKYEVEVEVLGDKFPSCTDQTCGYQQECANHSSAGDYRTEGGLTPDLRKIKGIWRCSKSPGRSLGAILVNGKILDIYNMERE